jgi:hypothetical protein
LNRSAVRAGKFAGIRVTPVGDSYRRRRAQR